MYAIAWDSLGPGADLTYAVPFIGDQPSGKTFRVAIGGAPTSYGNSLRLELIGNFGASELPVPSDIPADTLLLLHRDKTPFPAGCFANIISGEDVGIRFGSTNQSVHFESRATVGMFDYDIITRAFRYVPKWYAYSNGSRGPGAEFAGEKFTILDDAALVPPLARAVSTATQKNSNDFWVAGSLWTGIQEKHTGLAIRVIASTTVDNTARVGFLWGTNLISEYPISGVDRTFAEYAALYSAGYFDFGPTDNTRIRIDVFTDPDKPLISTVASHHLLFGVNSAAKAGISTAGKFGVGSVFDWDSVLPETPIHVYTSDGSPVKFQRDNGSAATRGYLELIISTLSGSSDGDAVLDSPNDIAIRSNAGSGGMVRVKKSGQTFITGVALSADGDTNLNIDRRDSGNTENKQVKWKDFSSLGAGDKVMILTS